MDGKISGGAILAVLMTSALPASADWIQPQCYGDGGSRSCVVQQPTASKFAIGFRQTSAGVKMAIWEAPAFDERKNFWVGIGIGLEIDGQHVLTEVTATAENWAILKSNSGSDADLIALLKHGQSLSTMDEKISLSGSTAALNALQAAYRSGATAGQNEPAAYGLVEVSNTKPTSVSLAGTWNEPYCKTFTNSSEKYCKIGQPPSTFQAYAAILVAKQDLGIEFAGPASQVLLKEEQTDIRIGDQNFPARIKKQSADEHKARFTAFVKPSEILDAFAALRSADTVSIPGKVSVNLEHPDLATEAVRSKAEAEGIDVSIFGEAPVAQALEPQAQEASTQKSTSPSEDYYGHNDGTGAIVGPNLVTSCITHEKVADYYIEYDYGKYADRLEFRNSCSFLLYQAVCWVGYPEFNWGCEWYGDEEGGSIGGYEAPREHFQYVWVACHIEDEKCAAKVDAWAKLVKGKSVSTDIAALWNSVSP
jgi:hypothetical protein